MALSTTALQTGLIQRILPPAQPDSRTVDSPARQDRYGGPSITYAAHSLNGLADSGALVVASNRAIGTPAAGTGVTFKAAVTSFADTTGSNFIVYNPEPAGGKSVHLNCLKMIATAVGTAAVGWQYLGILDPVGGMRSITTNNTAQASVSCVKSSITGAAGSPQLPVVYYQNGTTATTLGASSPLARTVSQGSLGALNVIADEFVIRFGSFEGSTTPPLTGAESAGIGTRSSVEGPVIIDPGHVYTLCIWATSSSASFNPDFLFWMTLL